MTVVEIVVSPRYFSIYTGSEIQYSLVDNGDSWTTGSTVEFNHFNHAVLIFYMEFTQVYYCKQVHYANG